jgi:HAD superfamily hydrolase (TIGR01509 family)
MIKLIIFDLDGVLVDTKDLHFNALNKVLLKTKGKHQISYSEHLKVFDGLPTMEKLNILFKKKLINKYEIKKIYNLKQKLTDTLLKENISYNNRVFQLFKKLKKKYLLAVATNSIDSTLKSCVNKLKINKFLDFKIGTNKLKFKKPHPEIYLRCLINLGISPNETLILEDSYVGRLAAKKSGCYLMPIKYLEDVSYYKIKNFIKEIEDNNSQNKSILWDDKEMNVLIPMAGAGSRFKEAGYTFPKPLIEIHGKPMIQWVIESLKIKAKYIFIIQSEHQKNFNIRSMLKAIQPECEIIEISEITEGAACTTLLAKKFINNNKPLIISNSDQFIEWDSSKIMYKFITKKNDGGILVFDSFHPKWSYAETNTWNEVVRVAEKEVISRNATVGVYYWKNGSDYVKYAESMINKNIRVNKEFYVCPVYNEAIRDGKKIAAEYVDRMWGLGTPEDLNYFLQNFKVANLR